jgi:hypothetical protein
LLGAGAGGSTTGAGGGGFGFGHATASAAPSVMTKPTSQRRTLRAIPSLAPSCHLRIAARASKPRRECQACTLRGVRSGGDDVIKQVGELDESRFGEAIDAALVDELYQRTSTSLGGLVLTLVVMRSVLGDVYDATLSLRIVFYALYVLIFVRAAHAYVASKKQGVWASPKARHVAFGIGSTAVALGFLAITVITLPKISPTQLGLLAVCQTAINGVALLSLGSSPSATALRIRRTCR